MSNDIVLYQRVSHLEKELDEVLKELSQLKQNYQEVLDMLKKKGEERCLKVKSETRQGL